MTAAAQLSTNAQPALIATNPANRPLHMSVGSGFIFFAHKVSMAAIAPVMLASTVLTATTLIARSDPARIEPELSPNHPKASTKVPTTTMGT